MTHFRGGCIRLVKKETSQRNVNARSYSTAGIRDARYAVRSFIISPSSSPSFTLYSVEKS